VALIKTGTVTAVYGRFCLVWGDGEPAAVVCELRGRHKAGRRTAVQPVAVGDRIEYQMQSAENGSVETILPRCNKISRAWSHRTSLEQVIASNIDQLLVVASLHSPRFQPGLVDRYLVAAEAQDISVAVCLNKTDLASEQEINESKTLYASIGYSVYPTCALDGVGSDLLEERLAGVRTLVVGPSGSGKSTLLNRFCPERDLRTAEVSAKTGEGRHTTTLCLLLKLRTSGEVIDTPGIRGFDVWGIEWENLSFYFPEFKPHVQQCRFRLCTHQREPDCGVLAALEAGVINAQRYESYCDILASLKVS